MAQHRCWSAFIHLVMFHNHYLAHIMNPAAALLTILSISCPPQVMMARKKKAAQGARLL
jgi:hypothetical protein